MALYNFASKPRIKTNIRRGFGQIDSRITNVYYRYSPQDPLTLVPATGIPPGRVIFLAIEWENSSLWPVTGHIDVEIITPSRAAFTLIATENQDAQSAGQRIMVFFESFIASEIGAYSVNAILKVEVEPLFPAGIQTWAIPVFDKPFPRTMSVFAYDWGSSIGLSEGSGLWAYPIYQFGTYLLNLTTGALMLLSPGGSTVQLFGTGFRSGASDWFLYFYDDGFNELGWRNVAGSYTVPTLEVRLQDAINEATNFIQTNTPLTIVTQQVSLGTSNSSGSPAILWPTDVDWSLIPQGNFTFVFWVAPTSGVNAAGLTWGLQKYDGINDSVYIAIPVAGGWKDKGLWWAGSSVDDWNLRLAQIIMHEWANGLKSWAATVGFNIQTLADLNIGREARTDWIRHYFPQITPTMWEMLIGG